MTTDTTDIAADPVTMDREAFDRTAAERAAIDLADVPPYTLDAMHAVGRALAIASRVQPLRDRMLGLAEFDVAHLDRLEDYARALRFAHTEVARRKARAREVRALAQQGWRIRALLMSYAETLSHKERFPQQLIDRLRKGAGYRALVSDLMVLAAQLETLPPGLVGPEAPVTKDDLARAVALADQLNQRMGNPADVDASRATLLKERRKLGGLLLRAHDEVRRAVTYLRWRHGDAAKLVPSLYVSRKRRAAERAAEPTQEPAAFHEPPAASVPYGDGSTAG